MSAYSVESLLKELDGLKVEVLIDEDQERILVHLGDSEGILVDINEHPSESWAYAVVYSCWMPGEEHEQPLAIVDDEYLVDAVVRAFTKRWANACSLD